MLKEDDKESMIIELMCYELDRFKENGTSEDVMDLIEYFKDLLLFFPDKIILKLYKEKFPNSAALYSLEA